MYKDGICLGSRRRDPEGAHVPRMQIYQSRAQQRRAVHGCQEAQALPAPRVLVETTSQESPARRGTASGASATVRLNEKTRELQLTVACELDRGVRGAALRAHREQSYHHRPNHRTAQRSRNAIRATA